MCKFLSRKKRNVKLKSYFKCEVGYSDHSIGSEACLAAVAMGSKIIEKHVTISKNLKGPDHKVSATINEFVKLVKKIREFEKMMGGKDKKVLKCELNTQQVSRKSLVTKNALKKGSTIKKGDLIFKRPGIGISPMQIKKILGKKLKKSLSKDKVLYSKYFKRWKFWRS